MTKLMLKTKMWLTRMGLVCCQYLIDLFIKIQTYILHDLLIIVYPIIVIAMGEGGAYIASPTGKAAFASVLSVQLMWQHTVLISC